MTVRQSPDDSGNIEFCIQDTGKGIPLDRLDIIFEPFRQVEIGDTRQHGGTGLGLTICKKLVEMMGGTLRVISSCAGEEIYEAGVVPSHGSQFIFTIPYQPAPGISQELTDATQSGRVTREARIQKTASDCQPNNTVQHPSRGRHRGKTVLVAEDDPVSRKVAVRMIEKAGYDVIFATDGAKAVAMFEEHKLSIGMIFMDVMMPNMDGLEATERIRDLEIMVGGVDGMECVPIVALSAGAMKGERERGLQAGMNDYLYKPVNRRELIKTLERYLVGEEDDVW